MKRSFLKDLFSVLTSRIAVILFGLGSTVVTARYLGPEGNGVIAALMVFPTLFMSIGSLGIRQSATYYTGQEMYDIKDIYGAVLAVWLFTGTFCVVCCYLIIAFFTKGHYSNTLIVLAIAGVPFSLYTTYASGIFLGQQNIKEFNRINWIPVAINLVVTFILIAIFPFGIEGSMVGTFSGSFIMFLIVLWKMRRKISLRPVFNFKIIKGMLSLGTLYAVSLLVISLNYKADVVLLEKYSNSYQIGIYSKGAALVEYLWQIPMLLSTLIFSRSVAAKDQRDFSIKTCRLLRFAGLITLLGCVLLYFLAGIVIHILYGAKFDGSISVLRILMPGVFLLTIFKVLNMDIAGRGKPMLSMAAMLPAVVLNIILNYFWIPQYGANGSALASTVSYTLAAIFFLIIYSRTVKISIKDIFLFDNEDKLVFLKMLTKIKGSISYKYKSNAN